MKVIQIAPHAEDCKVEENRIIGKMGGRVFIYEIPSNYRIEKEQHEMLVSCFREAIALCSKQWQIEKLLNEHFNVEGGKFYEQ